MKEKGTLLVVGSLLALSLATVTTARAAGTLNFTGKIINESCHCLLYTSPSPRD